MNKIIVEDLNKQNNLRLKEDTILILKGLKERINIVAENNIKVFCLILFSNIDVKYSSSYNTKLSIFTVDSSCNINIDLMKDDISFNYFYANINSSDNKYEININHLANNITSNITNHGINTTDSKLEYIINTVVPKEYIKIKTNQDSKIIVLKDNNSTIKPNLLIDNDDIEANHSAYIGRFNKEKIFYLMTRGISKENAIDLLVRSFLIGDMNPSYEEREIVLENIKKYWR